MRPLALVLLGACSFVSVRGPADPPAPPGDCTTSHAAPALDGIGAIAAGLVTVLGVVLIVDAAGHTCRSGIDQNCESYGAEAGLGILIGVPSAIALATYSASAVYGHHRVAACKARRAESRDR